MPKCSLPLYLLLHDSQVVGDPLLPIGWAGNTDVWREQRQQLFSLEGCKHE